MVYVLSNEELKEILKLPVIGLHNRNSIMFGELLEYSNVREDDLESYYFLYSEIIAEEIALKAYKIIASILSELYNKPFRV